MKTGPKSAHPSKTSQNSQDPRQPEARDLKKLLQASIKADDPETALEYAQRAVDLSPEDPEVLESVQGAVFEKLSQDAFVAFLAEDHRTYVVSFRNSRPVVIPKARTQPDIFPDPKLTQGEHVLGMMWWVVAGLLPAGIGAMILSPLVAGRAIDVLIRHKSEPRDRRLAWVTILLAGVFGCLGMIFSLLLAMHLVR